MGVARRGSGRPRDGARPADQGNPVRRARRSGSGRSDQAKRVSPRSLEKPLGRRVRARTANRHRSVGFNLPRRSGQPWSRNSAQWPRNFGRRGARVCVERTCSGSGGGPQWRGPSDCLPKTQDSAEAARRRIGSDACPVPEGHAEELAARRSPEAKPGKQQVDNYNGPKVAKFLVG